MISPSSLSPSSKSSTKKDDDDDNDKNIIIDDDCNDSYSDNDFEDGEEEEEKEEEKKTMDSPLTTKLTPITNEAGDDDLNDFLDGLSSSSSEEDIVKIECEKKEEVVKKSPVRQRDQKTESPRRRIIKNNSKPCSPSTRRKIQHQSSSSLPSSVLPSSKFLSRDKEEAVVWRRLHDSLKNMASPPVSILRNIQDQFAENDPDDLGYITSRRFLQILEPWMMRLQISNFQLSNILTALVREECRRSSSPRTDSLIQYGLFMAAMWMRSSVVPIDTVPLTLSPPRNDVSLDSPDQIVAHEKKKASPLHNRIPRRRPHTAANHRRSPLVSRLRCREIYGGGKKIRKKMQKKKNRISSTNHLQDPEENGPSTRTEETVGRLRKLVREKNQVVEALRNIAKREESHVRMLKTWSISSVENISEIEKVLQRRKKEAAGNARKKKKKKKKNSTKTRRALKSYLWERAHAMISRGKYEGDVLEAILDSYWQNKQSVSPLNERKKEKNVSRFKKNEDLTVAVDNGDEDDVVLEEPSPKKSGEKEKKEEEKNTEKQKSEKEENKEDGKKSSPS